MSKQGKYKHSPERIRLVLRYLYCNGWCSRESIANGCCLTQTAVRSMIREELSLREIERTPVGGGPKMKLYALPLVNC